MRDELFVRLLEIALTWILQHLFHTRHVNYNTHV